MRKTLISPFYILVLFSATASALTINGTTIPGIEFKKILWGVWLGKGQAVGKKMTSDMLGIK